MAALEVLALNTVIPQIQAPQVGDSYLFPRVAEFSAGTALLPSLAATGDLDTGMWFPAANTVAWSTGGLEAMRISSAGRVGIGTTNVDSPLTVAAISTSQSLRLLGRVSDDIVTFDFTNSAQTVSLGYIQVSGTYFAFATGTTERMRIKSAGQVRFVPLAADPTVNVEDGDVYYNSGTNKLRLRAAGAWVDLN